MVLSRRQLKLPIQGLTTYQIYGIFDPVTNQPVFDYDTFVSFKIDGKMKVSDFAVEQGAFATYNKVTHPNAIKIQLAVTDTPDRRHAFLTALDNVMKSTRLVNVVTQDATYLSMTLEGYSYSRTQASGWGKVVADLSLIEVRQVKAQYTSIKPPGGRGAVNNGQVIASVSPIFAPDATLASVTAYSAAQAKSATTGVQFINNASVSKASTKAMSTPAGASIIPTTAIIPSVR